MMSLNFLEMILEMYLKGGLIIIHLKDRTLFSKCK